MSINSDLNPWHKRQATLLYHFTSNEYLQGLLRRIDRLIAMANGFLDERTPFDSLGLAVGNWQQLDTAAHFSTHAFPALIEFREGVVEAIALRASEVYRTAGENQCGRMLEEYGHHMTWATPDQESAFKEEAAAVFSYAGLISSITDRLGGLDDFWFWIVWTEGLVDAHRIPRFRVRKDIVAFSDQPPPRTGVYVPKEGPYGALQFAWTGGRGELIGASSLNEFGRSVVQRIGRAGLWGDSAGLYEILDRNRGMTPYDWSYITADKAHIANSFVASECFEDRPSEWYFVEMIEGEFEEIDGTYAGTSSVDLRPQRVPAGKAVPTSGWWYTPAQGARRYFKEGEVFPEIVGSDWGSTFWLWAADQAAPRIG
ncbi:hypothetical protein ABB27_13995 [Stenotrophomonas terrae]|uniref:Uncharacterized protein n=1 Tax=Stenotrophomonas terrae TaxID=405446 RepID=A0A0R0CJU1_9GAMM|nr:hypothetical protein [Stenotrophomonas terrae]KRG66346.1 hypothetical protein ABB27_13995 [Stenotrophomonas terrae]